MTASLDDAMIAGHPIARWGTPDEVARMALFVAADVTYSTGSEFEVDGGATTGSMILTQTDTETGTAD